MGFWDDQVVPRCVAVALGTKAAAEFRQETVSGLSGTVVEIGFGSGLNVPFYPGEVDQVLAVEPSLVARRLAGKRVADATTPVRYVGLDGQQLPLEDASADAALSTFTLCTIPDVSAALDEVHRVLRPGGRFHFLEHGLAPDPAIAARQHRFNGLQQRVFDGCNLDREIDRLIEAAGFELEAVDHDWMPGPSFLKPWGYLYHGSAVRASARR
jgi:SAM-dependent methyltransferase